MWTSPAGWRRGTSLYLEATLALLAVFWMPEAARQTRERGGSGSNRTRQAIKQWRWIAVGAAEPRIRRQARGFRGGALAGLGSGLCCCRGRSGCWAGIWCAAEARTAQLQHGGLELRMDAPLQILRGRSRRAGCIPAEEKMKAGGSGEEDKEGNLG
jgi:hypothetical protein